MSNPRENARVLGKALNQEDLVNRILSGDMSADEIAPLIGGIMEEVVRDIVLRMIPAQTWVGFDAIERPLVGRLTLTDGSVLLITIGEEGR